MLLRLVFEQLEQSPRFVPNILDPSTPPAEQFTKNTIALVMFDTNDSAAGACLETITKHISPMQTILLSNCTNMALLNHWRSRGFERIVSMNAPFSQLLHCLHRTLEGEPFQCEFIKNLTKSARRGPLSVREHEVFELLVKGSTNKNIALLLGVGEKSVHTYRKRLMEKLSCSSLAELILYAQQSQKFK